MTTIATTDRPYIGEADLQPLCDLLNACDAVDQQDDNYAVDDLRAEFGDPRIDPARDLRIWQDADQRMLAFGQAWIQTSDDLADGYLYFRVLPEARGNGLEEEIIAWGEQRMREAGQEHGKPAVLRSGAWDTDDERHTLLTRHGYAVERYFFRMKRPLDQPLPEPQFPAGFTLQQTAIPADNERWVEVFNQSFIDHWNFHPMTVEAAAYWTKDPKYRNELDLIAVTDDNLIAAFCYCSIDSDDNARNQRSEGWINMLGTRRGYRNLGLGRAMLLAGMHTLKRAGVQVAKLGVDAQNPNGALRLYESVGFSVAFTNILYTKELG